MDSDIDLSETRQFGGGYGGYSGYGGSGYGGLGGYGLGGYGYGGFVECCEGVVDPILLLGVIVGLAALTWWLRLQVVTYISGRSLQYDYLEEITNHLLGPDTVDHVKTE